MEVTLIHGVAALAGAAGVGTFVTGVPPTMLATSVSGAAGAALGFVAGSYVGAQYSTSPGAAYYGLLGAGAVPALASGAFDTEVIALAAGAYLGAMLYDMLMAKKQ
jgi:hypothetical protein